MSSMVQLVPRTVRRYAPSHISAGSLVPPNVQTWHDAETLPGTPELVPRLLG